MTYSSNDVIAPTAQVATPAITFFALLSSEAAFPSASPFLVFESLYLAPSSYIYFTDSLKVTNGRSHQHATTKLQ